jgi:hypothetical protein
LLKRGSSILKLTGTGLPPGKGLEGLGLGFVIPVLESMNAIGQYQKPI